MAFNSKLHLEEKFKYLFSKLIESLDLLYNFNNILKRSFQNQKRLLHSS